MDTKKQYNVEVSASDTKTFDSPSKRDVLSQLKRFNPGAACSVIRGEKEIYYGTVECVAEGIEYDLWLNSIL